MIPCKIGENVFSPLEQTLKKTAKRGPLLQNRDSAAGGIAIPGKYTKAEEPAEVVFARKGRRSAGE